MLIPHTEYNQVIDGLRMQLTLLRRFEGELQSEIKQLKEVVGRQAVMISENYAQGLIQGMANGLAQQKKGRKK